MYKQVYFILYVCDLRSVLQICAHINGNNILVSSTYIRIYMKMFHVCNSLRCLFLHILKCLQKEQCALLYTALYSFCFSRINSFLSITSYGNLIDGHITCAQQVSNGVVLFLLCIPINCFFFQINLIILNKSKEKGRSLKFLFARRNKIWSVIVV